MKSIKNSLFPACFTFILLISGQSAWAGEFTASKPADGTSLSNTYSSGLNVSYFFKLFDHVDELQSTSGGKPGDPIEQLNHVSYEDGQVLTTDRSSGVGAQIRGLIKFATAGKYILKLQSNDGVKLTIGGVLLHTDPEIHAARWSPDLIYQVQTPGWYNINLDYYQRKGTAALRMKWVTPDGTEEVIPAEAFAHL